MTEIQKPMDLNPKKQDATKKPNLKYHRDRDREPVKGKFIFHECPGGTMSFSFRAYKEDPVERYDLVDGQIYTIPLGVAKHLNKNCWYPEYAYLQGETTNNNPTQGGYSMDGRVMKMSKKVRRVSFQSLEFIDETDLTPSVDFVSVEYVK